MSNISSLSSVLHRFHTCHRSHMSPSFTFLSALLLFLFCFLPCSLAASSFTSSRSSSSSSSSSFTSRFHPSVYPNFPSSQDSPFQSLASGQGFNLTLVFVNYLDERFYPMEQSLNTITQQYTQCTITQASCVGGLHRIQTVLNSLRRYASTGQFLSGYSWSSRFKPMDVLTLTPGNAVHASRLLHKTPIVQANTLQNSTTAAHSAAALLRLMQNIDCMGVGSGELLLDSSVIDSLATNSLFYNSPNQLFTNTNSNNDPAYVSIPTIPLVSSSLTPASSSVSRSQVFWLSNGDAAGVLSWNTQDLIAATRFTQIAGAGAAITNDINKLQIEIYNLNQRYLVNKIIVMTSYLDPTSLSELTSFSNTFLANLIGVDVLMIEQRTLSQSSSWKVTSSVTGQDTVVVICPPYGRSLCLLNIPFDSAGNIIYPTSGSLEYLNVAMTSSITPDATILAHMNKEERVAFNPTLAVASLPSTYTDFQSDLQSSVNLLRYSEIRTGNLIADSIANELQTTMGCDFALVPAGSIRNVIQLNSGQAYTMKQLQQLVPFSNLINLVQMKGEDVLLLLENGVSLSSVSNPSSPSYNAAKATRFLQLSKRLRMIWNPNAAVGERVVQVQVLMSRTVLNTSTNINDVVVSWKDLEMATIYSVGLIDSVTFGMEGFNNVFTGSDSTKKFQTITYTNTQIEKAIQNYLLTSKLNQTIEGRISTAPFQYPPVVRAVSPLYGDLASSTTLTLMGANLGLVVVRISHDANNNPIPILPSDTTINTTTITINSLPCAQPRVLTVSLSDGTTQASSPYGYLASVSSLTCVFTNNYTTFDLQRISVDTRSSYYSLLGVVGGFRSTRLDSIPLNFTTAVPSSTCPPKSSYLSATGVCVCRAGYIQSTVSGVKVCTACAAGTYSSVDDSFTCQPCPPGTRSASTDYQCTACSINTYNNFTASSTCYNCPSFSTTLGRNSSLNCTCNPGYMAVTVNNSLSCVVCPFGAECTSTPGIAKAQPNWWYDEYETKSFYRCPNEFCCNKRGSGCTLNDSSRCYPNREGFLCGSCKVGYSSTAGHACRPCTQANVGAIVALIILGLLFLGFCLYENPSEDASTKLIVDYIQMCALVLSPRIDGSDILKIFHLDFSSTTSFFDSCVFPMPAYVSAFAVALPPFLLYAMLGLIHLIHWLCVHTCAKQHLAHYEHNRWRYTNAAWEIWLFGFMAVCSACVQILDCSQVGLHYVVTVAPSVECFADTHFYLAILALAIFCLVTFVVPIWLVALLSHLSQNTERRPSLYVHAMKQIKQVKKKIKRASISSSDESALFSEFQTDKVQRCGHEVVLWCYNQDAYWAEAFFLLRRVMFTLITVIMSAEKASMVIVWFCVSILVIHARYPVFRKQSSRYFHDFCLGAIAIQCALNLDAWVWTSDGSILFDTPENRAQVIIIYGIVIAPIILGIGLFVKEFWKERIRKQLALKKKDADNDSDTDTDEEEEAEEEDDLVSKPLQLSSSVNQMNLVDLEQLLSSSNIALLSQPANMEPGAPPVTIHF